MVVIFYMKSSKKLAVLSTTHPRIIDFYNKYDQLNFETLNLTIIDHYENIIQKLFNATVRAN